MLALWRGYLRVVPMTMVITGLIPRLQINCRCCKTHVQLLTQKHLNLTKYHDIQQKINAPDNGASVCGALARYKIAKNRLFWLLIRVPKAVRKINPYNIPEKQNCPHRGFHCKRSWKNASWNRRRWLDHGNPLASIKLSCSKDYSRHTHCEFLFFFLSNEMGRVRVRSRRSTKMLIAIIIYLWTAQWDFFFYI